MFQMEPSACAEACGGGRRGNLGACRGLACMEGRRRLDLILRVAVGERRVWPDLAFAGLASAIAWNRG